MCVCVCVCQPSVLVPWQMEEVKFLLSTSMLLAPLGLLQLLFACYDSEVYKFRPGTFTCSRCG